MSAPQSTAVPSEREAILLRVKQAVAEVHSGSSEEADRIIDAVIVSLFQTLADGSKENRGLYLAMCGWLRR